MTERYSFSKINEIMEMPDLIEIQRNSYNWFLKKNNIPSGRKNYSEVVGMLIALSANQD